MTANRTAPPGSPLPLAERRSRKKPFLTIAIPHYRHRRHLEAVLASIFDQESGDLEIVVSDDRSPDDSNDVIPPILKASGRPFRYYAQPVNLGYDANVRFCLTAARGTYVMLLGNDDGIASDRVVSELIHALQNLDEPEVAITNFRDASDSDETTRRTTATVIIGKGPAVAARMFRSFSFVSGLIYKTSLCHTYDTDRWDGSIYYQIYLATRIIAAGGRVAGLDVCAIAKDLRVDGEKVPNYVSRWADAGWSLEARHTGLDSVIRVTLDALAPHVAASQAQDLGRAVISQVLMTTYPFWLFEYRKVANWSFSFGIARGLWPSDLMSEHQLDPLGRVRIWMIYLVSTAMGLTIPPALFRRAQGFLSTSVRARLQRA